MTITINGSGTITGATTMASTIASPTMTTPTLTTPTMTGAVVSSMGSSVLTLGTAVNSTSGTSIDFTGIPSWARRVTVGFYGVSTNGASAVLFQLGSGSAQTTGYLAAYGYLTNSNSNASTQPVGFPIWPVGGAAGVTYGQIQFCCMNPSTYIWTAQGQFMQTGYNYCMVTSGAVTLTGALDRVRITSVSSDTFDAGSINIIYE